MANVINDVERQEPKKKVGAHAVTFSIVDETLNRFLESTRNYLNVVCDGTLAYSTWKSDLVKNLGCFDYSFIFGLTREQATACFGCLFHSFSVPGWVAK